MESSEQRLTRLMDEIGMIYLQSKSKEDQTLQKKLENYQNGTLLLSEAKKLLDELQNDVSTIDTSKISKSQITHAKKYIELLSAPNLNFTEVMRITTELKKMAAGIPTTTNVNDNVEKEVIIYEEQDIEA